MYLLWKTSTVVLMIQIFFSVAAFLITGNVFYAGMTATAAAVVIMLLAFLYQVIDRYPQMEWASIGCVAFASACAALAITLDHGSLYAVFGFLAVCATVSAVLVADLEDPRPGCFCCALPAGIGFLVGGLLLFARSRKPVAVD